MTISIEQLLNIPGIRVLSVKYDEHKVRCQVESTQGYSICHTCGRKATEFHEHGQELELRHLRLCGGQVILRLRPKRYRCRHCEGAVTPTERADWYDAKAGCTQAYAEFLLLERVNGTLRPRLLRLTEPRLPSCPYHSQGVLLGAQTLRPARSGQPVPLNLQ